MALLTTITILSTGVLWAQMDKATITGTVSDPTGALVIGTKVVVTNARTGVTYGGMSNGVGLYTVQNLPVGAYTVSFSHAGFATLVRTNLDLVAGQVLQINARLQVGSTAESVTVTTTPSLLENETSSVGTTLDADAITDLPMDDSGGRDASRLFFSTIPVMRGSNYQSNIAGSQLWSKTVLIDGTDGNTGMQGFVQPPGMDAIQEMSAQVSGIGSEGAGTGGGIIMYETKSGTNQFHGSGYGFLRNEFLNSNTWENNWWKAYCVNSGIAAADYACNNMSDYRRAKNRWNDWGFSAGGPLWRKHTFIFGDWEEYNQTDLRQSPASASVPTAKMLSGDFSELLEGGPGTGMGTYSGTVTTTPGVAGGTPIINPCTGLAYQYGQIFDPATWTTVNGTPCGQPFQGNIIPPGRFSSVSKKLIPVFQKYYAPTVSGKLTGNYPTMSNGTPWINQYNVDLKLDHNFSQQHHLSTSFNYGSYPETTAGDPFNLSAGGGPFNSAWLQKSISRTFRVIDSYTFRSSLVNTASVAMGESFSHELPYTLVDPATYGFESFNSKDFPQIVFNGSNGNWTTGLGYGGEYYAGENGFHYEDTLSWLKGRHNFKFGGEFSALQNNNDIGGNAQEYTFSNKTGGPTDSRVTPYVGFGFANFLLGDVGDTPIASYLNIPDKTYDRRKLFDIFAQDDFRVTSKLTINAGLRWDVNFPMHEKFGHWTNFDITANNPNWGSYPGAWAFAKNGSDSFEKNNDYHEFGPHVGAAYQITDKLVARAAYGIFYVPFGMNMWGAQSNPGHQDYFFNGTNNVENPTTGAVAFNWDSGYPGITTYGSRTSSQTSIPGVPDYIDPNELRLGRTQNWNAGIEYQFAKNMLVNVGYMGNIGRDLHDSNLNAWKNYPSWGVYQAILNAPNVGPDWTLCSPADAAWDSNDAGVTVPYPYPGFCSYVYAAIAPFPQLMSNGGMRVVDVGAPVGESAFNAFTAEVKARHAHGLTMDINYAFAKNTGSVRGNSNFWNAGNTYWFQSVQDFSDAKHWVLGSDVRHMIKGYVTYNLPLGRNQRWLSGVHSWNYLVGGWEVGFQPSYNSSAPMSGVGNGYGYSGWMGLRANMAKGAKIGNHFNGKIDLKNLGDSSNQDFDPTMFSDVSWGNLGTSPAIFNDWRWKWGKNENMSLLKHFSFREDGRLRATVRAEFFNVFNRHSFGSPDMGTPDDQYFGQVTSVYGSRSGQLGARFEC